MDREYKQSVSGLPDSYN